MTRRLIASFIACAGGGSLAQGGAGGVSGGIVSIVGGGGGINKLIGIGHCLVNGREIKSGRMRTRATALVSFDLFAVVLFV